MNRKIENLGGRVYREYYNHSERKIPGAISPRDLFRKHPEWSGIYVNWQSIDTAYQLIIAAKKKKDRIGLFMLIIMVITVVLI